MTKRLSHPDSVISRMVTHSVTSSDGSDPAHMILACTAAYDGTMLARLHPGRPEERRGDLGQGLWPGAVGGLADGPM